MKLYSLLILILALSLCSCDPRNIGPVGSFYYGNYKLTAYSVKGQLKAISSAPDHLYLETNEDIDSVYFLFKDANKKTIIRIAAISDFDVNKKRTEGYYKFKTADGRAAEATLVVNKLEGKNTKLVLGNFMKGAYNHLSDTIKYTYLPE